MRCAARGTSKGVLPKRDEVLQSMPGTASVRREAAVVTDPASAKEVADLEQKIAPHLNIKSQTSRKRRANKARLIKSRT